MADVKESLLGVLTDGVQVNDVIRPNSLVTRLPQHRRQVSPVIGSVVDHVAHQIRKINARFTVMRMFERNGPVLLLPEERPVLLGQSGKPLLHFFQADPLHLISQPVSQHPGLLEAFSRHPGKPHVVDNVYVSEHLRDGREHAGHLPVPQFPGQFLQVIEPSLVRPHMVVVEVK